MSSVVLSKVISTSAADIYTYGLSYLDRTTQDKLVPKVLFKYDVPNAVLFGNVKKVTLQFTMYFPHPECYNVDYTKIRPCSWDENNAQYLSYGNYNGYVCAGTGITFTEALNPTSNYTTITKDITSIFSNNIDTDNTFSFDLDFVGDTLLNNINQYPLEERFYYVETDPILTVTYEELTVSSPNLYSPCGTYIDRADETKFSWSFVADGNVTQASATLEYKKINDTEYNVITVNGSQNEYVLGSYALQTGAYTWRVKTTDSNGNSSSYASSQFSVLEAPSKATIYTQNSCLPTIRWNAIGQVAYEAYLFKEDEELDHINGGNEQYYKVKNFIENGAYSIRVNIRNEFGLWSGWSEKTFVVNITDANKPVKPTIHTSTAGYNVNVNVESTSQTNYLYRIDEDGNETRLCKISTNFLDKTCRVGKENRYFVRSFNGVGYRDSDIVSNFPNCRGFVLSTRDVEVNITKSIDKFMMFQERPRSDKKLVNYLGRKNYVVEQSEFKENTLSREFLCTEKELELLQIIETSSVALYRDDRNRKMYCTITSIDFTNEMCDMMYKVTMQLTQVDYKEGVDLID